jgi:L-lactate dehydrogenase complex protein LldG
MTNRAEFLSNISACLGRESLFSQPPPLSYQHDVHEQVMAGWSQEKITVAFMEYSRAIGVTVVETIKDKLNETLVSTVTTLGGGVCLLANEPLFEEMRTRALLSAHFPVDVWDIDQWRQENVQKADKAKVGIAVAECALAESATVLFFCNRGAGRSVTLLPEAAIYVMPQSVIRPRLTQAMAFIREHLDEGLPSSINLVSGPSATSDIELVRVVGVHGPMRVAHVVVTDL